MSQAKQEKAEEEEEESKVLRASYTTEIFFPIPKGLDLEDKKFVKDYWVKYGTLYIALNNGKTIQIESASEYESPKYPDDLQIEDNCIGLNEECFDEANKIYKNATQKQNIKRKIIKKRPLSSFQKVKQAPPKQISAKQIS